MLEYLTKDQLLVFSKYDHKAPKTTLELFYINNLLKGLEARLPAVITLFNTNVLIFRDGHQIQLQFLDRVQ